MSGGRRRGWKWHGPCAPCCVEELNVDARAYDRYALRSAQAQLNGMASLVELDAAASLGALVDPFLRALEAPELVQSKVFFEGRACAALLPPGLAAPSSAELGYVLKGAAFVSPAVAAVPVADALRALCGATQMLKRPLGIWNPPRRHCLRG